MQNQKNFRQFCVVGIAIKPLIITLMTVSQFIFKVRFRLWGELVAFSEKRWFYHYLYRSYWHYKFSRDKINTSNLQPDSCYYTARPNPGAGIGHQLANWITGHLYADLFGLRFAHIPFSTQQWEDFFGLGENETKVEDLKKKGYRMRKLPTIDEKNPQDIALTKLIIQSYTGKKIVFIAEQDQNTDEFGEIDLLKQRFAQAKARKNDRLLYSKENFNIAIHMRRTVIIEGKKTVESKAVQTLRWLGNDYYEKVLRRALDNISISKPISIYIFSAGSVEEFAEFSKYDNVHLCLDMDEYASFLHLVRADMLITSKSSFSYKPALMNDCIKICPIDFWHNYPDDIRWIIADENGVFDEHQLKQVLAQQLQ